MAVVNPISSFPNFLKDPDAVLDYGWDWSQWLQTAETIMTSTMIASPGVTINLATSTNTTTTVWLSGGTAGTPYQVTNKIVTNQGRTEERTITIRCQAR